jgi:hypothetical protein
MAFRPALNEYKSVGDPLMTSDFFLMIPFIPGSPDPRKLSYKVINTSLPGSQIEQIPYEIGARKFNFAGRRVYSGTWTAQLVETADASTRADLLRWMDITRPYASGNGTYKNQYSVSAELRVYDAANRVAVSSVIKGMFPLSIEDSNLDQSSTVLQYSVQFSFDEVDETYNSDE